MMKCCLNIILIIPKQNQIGSLSKSLAWQSAWRLQDALEKTVQWHQNFLSGVDMKFVSLSQINAYQQGKQET